jgi:tripartite-type tricarboxylate transporter receptor subunit TctC
MKTPEQKAMVSFIETAPKIGMGFWVSPDVPKDRLEALRKAFIAMLNDPEFRADAKKRRAPVDAVSGETLQKLVASAYATPKTTVTKLKSVLGFK